MKLILLGLRPEGFETNEMQLEPGDYLFIIGNRTGLQNVNVRLDREGNERIDAALVGGPDIQYGGLRAYAEENIMNRTVLFTFLVATVAAVIWLDNDAVETRASETITKSFRSAECFHDTELRENIATLKQQGGADVKKVSESLLAKSGSDYGCRVQVVQALISSMSQATNPATNQYENFFLWLHGAGLLADLKATEALDLLIANIDFTDGFSATISESHFPALVAIVRIGQPAIPKLQVVLINDSESYKRKFAAFCIAYIGGDHAKMALKTGLPRETDPCVKRFLQISLTAFNNKAKPNHVSSALNGKWLGAFYCR